MMHTNSQTTQLPLNFPTKSHAFHTLENKDIKKAIVFNAIKTLGECSDADIAKYLGWERTRVIPRRSELMEEGLVIKSGVKIGAYGKPEKVYKVIEL